MPRVPPRQAVPPAPPEPASHQGEPAGPADAPGSSQAGAEEVLRLAEVMHRLRRECPWDAEQTHRSLATYLVEETGEVLDAIEAGSDTDLVEELGDLMLQVVFHAEIAAGEGRFGLDEVARQITAKLVRRHPHVFADGPVPADMDASWEARKRAEKGRTSALEGIAEHLSALARAQKVVSRARSHGVALALATEPIAADQLGAEILLLVQRAQASAIDAEQATRDALRLLEEQVRTAEAGGAAQAH